MALMLLLTLFAELGNAKILLCPSSEYVMDVDC